MSIFSTLQWPRKRPAFIGLLLVCAAALLSITLWPMDPRPYLTITPSQEVLDRNGRMMFVFLRGDGQWCFRRPLDAFSPYLIQATIAAEDQRFFSHPGIDPVAIGRAAWQNIKSARVKSGASTLTMQVVKGALPSSRSLWGKLSQAALAVRLERHATKDEILNAYLNNAPYGLNLIGAEAAARRYFGKPARELTLAEAALLAGLPKAPSALAPTRHPEQAIARRNHVLTRMCVEGFVSDETLMDALAEPLNVHWNPFSQLAPHVATQLRPMISPEQPLMLTLDSSIQQQVEQRVGKLLSSVQGEVDNAAAIVIDTVSASVLARVGSCSFLAAGSGQYDAARARRSPGSTLKPFVYALAMEKNLLYPSEILLDDSLDLGSYRAENFDGNYNGLVMASDALRYSLNVPAVMVLNRVSPEALLSLLRSLGLSTLERPADYYGLGLTLGNCEVRLDQLAAAYTMLANLGEYRPTRLLVSEAPATPIRSLSRGTCLALWKMLEQPLPNEADRDRIKPDPPTRVCWKTGTSTGLHDAWAFVFNAHYVVGIWMGNNDGRPSSKLVGARTALPLAGAIFRSLEPHPTAAWPDTLDSLKPVRVCVRSGLPASQWCSKTKEELFPCDQLLHRICDVHYPLEEQIAERWPGSADSWDTARVTSAMAAVPNRDAFKTVQQSALRILEPAHLAQYILTGEQNGDRIRLKSSKDETDYINWYLDERHLGSATPQSPLFLDLTPGRHTLACLTASGAVDSVTIEVLQPTPPQFNKE